MALRIKCILQHIQSYNMHSGSPGRPALPIHLHQSIPDFYMIKVHSTMTFNCISKEASFLDVNFRG